MQLFYTPDIDLSLDRYTLDEEESNHCVKVLRMRSGETLNLCDGRGNMIEARVADPHPKRCVVEIVSVRPDYNRRPYRLHVAAAPTKNIERYEWFVEKATEIGVDRLTPVLCEHSERKIIKTDRIEKVATSAMKQSLKAFHPQIDPLTPLKDIITAPFDGQKFIAHCEPDPDKRPLVRSAAPGTDTLILIGPEGDFAPAEIALAKKHGFRSVSLGESRLRTETAGIAAVHTIALVNEHFEQREQNP